MNCVKCKKKLDCTEERDFQEAKDFDSSLRPICDECYNMEDFTQTEQDYEQHSDADSGL